MNMQNKLGEPRETEDRDKKAELEAFFLEKTADKLDSTSKESALQVAAAFDRLKKEAEKAGESHFKQLLGASSQSLKNRFLDRKEDYKKLDDF